jgi:hypothetical protein
MSRGISIMRVVAIMLRSMRCRGVLMPCSRSDRLRAVDVTEKPRRRQRPSNGQQQRDQQQQNGTALHRVVRLTHANVSFGEASSRTEDTASLAAHRMMVPRSTAAPRSARLAVSSVLETG